MKVFAFLSNYFTEKEVVLGYPEFSGPSYPCRDALFIAAPTRSRAKYLYEKKFQNISLEVTEWIGGKTKFLGECDIEEGFISWEDAEKMGYYFPDWE